MFWREFPGSIGSSTALQQIGNDTAARDGVGPGRDNSIASKCLLGLFRVLARQMQAQGSLQLILCFLLLPNSRHGHSEVVAVLGGARLLVDAFLEQRKRASVISLL